MGAWENEEVSYYLLMKNLRNGFPKAEDPPLRTFPEWYLINKNVKAKEGLAKHKEATKKFLTTFTEKGMQYVLLIHRLFSNTNRCSDQL